MLWSASALLRPQVSNATSMSASRLADRRIERVNPNAIRLHKTTLISDQVLMCLTLNPWWIGKLLKPAIWVKRSFHLLMSNFKKNITRNKNAIDYPKKTHQLRKAWLQIAGFFFGLPKLLSKFSQIFLKTAPHFHCFGVQFLAFLTAPITVQTDLTRRNPSDATPIGSKSNRFALNHLNVK